MHRQTGMVDRISTDVAHTSRWRTFEGIVGIPFLAGIALHFVAPIPVPPAFPSSLLKLAGGALILAGLALVVLARRELARHGQPTDPGHPTDELVTSGVYAVSRNPLYVGGACVLAGVALGFLLVWSMVLLLPALVACHYLLVAPEERYLDTRFGGLYRSYAGDRPSLARPTSRTTDLAQP